MLHELIRHAERVRPQSEPGFASETIRWAIEVTAEGEPVGVIELGDTSPRNNPGKRFEKAPRLEQAELRAGKKKDQAGSQFLWETLAVVLGFRPRDQQWALKKQEAFRSLLDRAAQAVPSLRPLAEAMRRTRALERLRDDLKERRARPEERVTFCVEGKLPLEGDEWHAWWRDYWSSLAKLRKTRGRYKAGEMVCLATGEVVRPARTHPKVRNVPGAGGEASLVGFDKPAFDSYGLSQSANAAVSEEAARQYVDALQELMRKASVRLADTAVLHWYAGQVQREDDPLAWLEDPAEVAEADALARARELLRAIQDGRRPDLGANRYYVLALSGVVGRLMVREWVEGDFRDLVLAVNAWFEDLNLIAPDGTPRRRLPGFHRLIEALAERQQGGEGSARRSDRRSQELPGPLAARLYRAAVRNEVLPHAILWRALWRAQTAWVQGQHVRPECIALIRAYLVRRERSAQRGGTNMAEQIRPGLNEELPSVAYQCGRLMAVLADLQRTALGGRAEEQQAEEASKKRGKSVGADVIQRFYAAASATPALVLGRLIRGAQFHLGKLQSSSPGLAHWYENRIAEICSRIGTSLPATLSLEEQGLFALGYYHQLAANRAGGGKEATEVQR